MSPALPGPQGRPSHTPRTFFLARPVVPATMNRATRKCLVFWCLVVSCFPDTKTDQYAGIQRETRNTKHNNEIRGFPMYRRVWAGGRVVLASWLAERP